MLMYVSALLSGTADPFWPNFELIAGSVLAGIAVGAGIILESPQYPIRVHRVAKWLVIVGVAVESVCTVCLFVFDEGISEQQQEKIVLLETEALPRNLKNVHEIAAALRPFGSVPYDLTIPLTLEPGSYLVNQIIGILRDAGWKIQSVEGPVHKLPLNPLIAMFLLDPKELSSGVRLPTVIVGSSEGFIGVGIDLPASMDPKTERAATELFKQINNAKNGGVEAHFVFDEPSLTGNALHIIIGSKP